MKREVIKRFLLTFVFIMALSFAAAPQPARAAETPPDAPGDFEVTGSVGNVILRWEDNSDNELGFLIERQDPGGSWTEIGSANPGETEYFDTLTAPGTYYYRVRAFNNFGASAYSDQDSFVYDTGRALAAPTDLYIGSSSSGSFIVLQWTDNAGADTAIERQDPGGDWADMGSTNQTVWSEFLPSPGTYRYRVRAWENSWYSDYSNIVDYAYPSGINDGDPTPAPRDLTAAGSGNRVTLDWTGEGGMGYTLERRDPGGSWDEVGETTPDITIYLDTVSAPGTYRYRVKAWSNNGESDYSNEAGYTYSKNNTGSLPVAPSNLTASVWGPDVFLRWTYSSEDVTGFIVEKKLPGGSWNEIADTNRNVLSYSDKVTETGTHYYRVRAINNSGTSEPSNEASAMVQSLTITGITITLQINEPYMTVNNVVKEIDPGRGTVPVIAENRTLLPVRAIVEALGGTIAWDETTRKVTIKDNSATIELWVGNNITYVNGVKKITDVAPQIINERTMTPVRFIVENLGAAVDWDSANKVIIIRR
ncbi:stalk domain-containing protein [Pelotomaculum propionicicum]|uniref:stalk domain-containing protein n=1 Tax=Pelotomaculum propionicicum TaxID=258475 RepID=UPI003B7F17BA